MKQFHVAFFFAFALAAPTTSWAQATVDYKLLGDTEHSTADVARLSAEVRDAAEEAARPKVGQRWVYKSEAGYTQGGIVQKIDHKTGNITLVSGEQKIVSVVPGPKSVFMEPKLLNELVAKQKPEARQSVLQDLLKRWTDLRTGAAAAPKTARAIDARVAQAPVVAANAPVVAAPVAAVKAPVAQDPQQPAKKDILAEDPTDSPELAARKKELREMEAARAAAVLAQAEAAKIAEADKAVQNPAKPDEKPADKKEEKLVVLSEAELKEKAKLDFQAKADDIRTRISAEKEQFKTDARDADCTTCNQYTTVAKINQIAAELVEIENLEPRVFSAAQREIKKLVKEATEEIRIADAEGKIVKIEENASTRGAQNSIDEIFRLVELVKPGRSKEDQDKYVQFCKNADRAVLRIGKDAYKEEESDRDDDEDERGGFWAGARQIGQGFGMVASTLANPMHIFAGELGFSGRADDDELGELDVETDESGAAAYRNAAQVTKACLKKATGKARKSLKERMFNNVGRMFNHLAGHGPNNALEYYAHSTKFRNTNLAKDCRLAGKSVECMMLAAGAQADAIRFQQGREAMYKSYFDASKIDITMGTNKQSVKDPATGAEVLFPGWTDYNQSLIKGMVPTSNPFTNPVADAVVNPQPRVNPSLSVPLNAPSRALPLG